MVAICCTGFGKTRVEKYWGFYDAIGCNSFNIVDALNTPNSFLTAVSSAPVLYQYRMI